MASETLNFSLFARDNASKTFDKFGRTVDDTDNKFSKLGRGLASVGKVAAVGLAAGVGFGAVALKKFVGDARESERVTKLTEAVIKSTGGAAKVSAAQVAALSTSISNKTGVDDEAIQTGSNLLLTFKNVRNEVGEGNKVFNEATQAAVDLSAAGFGSIESSSKMLGKALNDPVKGITALSRAGVTFTDEQKKQIEQWVKHGDVLKAQNAILGEVQSQVGGAAAATGTATDKLKVTLGNLSEQIGAKLLPYVDKVAGALGGFIGQMQSGKGAGGALAGFLTGTVLPALSSLGGFITGTVVPAVKSLADWFTGTLVPIFQRVGETLLPKLKSMFESVSGTIKDNEGTFRAIGIIARDLIIPMVTRVAGLLVDVLGPAFKAVMWVIRNGLIPVWASLVGVVLDAAWVIVNAAAKAFGWVPGLGGKLKGAAASFNKFRDDVKATLDQIVAAARGTGENFGAGMAAGIRASTGLAVGAAGDMANRIAAHASAVLEERSPSKVGFRIGQFFPEGVGLGIKDKTAVALDAVSEMAAKIVDKLKALRQAARDIARGAADSVRGMFDWGGIGATTTTPGGTDAEGNALPDVSTTASPVAQFADFAAQSRAFAGAVSQAVAHGLDPRIVAQAVGTGNLTVVQSLAALDPASAGSVNRDFALAQKFAAQVGQTVLSTTSIPADIARQQSTLDTLKDIKRSLASGKIEFHIHDATDPDAVVAAIRRYIKKNGKLRDVAAD